MIERTSYTKLFVNSAPGRTLLAGEAGAGCSGRTTAEQARGHVCGLYKKINFRTELVYFEMLQEHPNPLSPTVLLLECHTPFLHTHHTHTDRKWVES